jgi:hypothetical protein
MNGDVDLEETHRNQGSRNCPVCTPLAPPRKKIKIKISSQSRHSCRIQFSPRHNHKLQVRPPRHSIPTTAPPTTTSASSSDLRPRTYAKLLGLLPYANRRTHEVWNTHTPPITLGVVKRQKSSSIPRYLRYLSSRSRSSRLLFNLDFAFSVSMPQLTGCTPQAFSSYHPQFFAHS